MAIRKVKISELPLEKSLNGLHTIGVNSKNESVKVSLEFVEDAANKANNAADNADRSREKIEANEAGRQRAEEARAAAENIRETQETAREKASQTAVKYAETAADNANQAAAAATTAKGATEEATRQATEAATKANAAADRVTDSITDITAEKEAALKAAAKATEAATQADTSRQQIEANEETRKTAEQSRATAEQERKAAETAREKASAEAVKNAQTATQSANDAAGAAKQAAGEAQTAAQTANTAAQNATTKAGEASAAATNATKAKTDAEAATKKATDAAASATSAATQATTAAGRADAAAAGATTAKEDAEEAISRMEKLEAGIEQQITGITEAYKAADSALDGKLQAEIARATGEETAIRNEYAEADTKTLAEAKKHAETKIADLVGSAPEALNTLEELADALGKNENFSTEVLENIGKKAEKTYVAEELAKKVNKAGDTMTGPLVINPGAGLHYDDGIRISLSKGNWASIAFGSTGATGVPTNGWFVARNPDNIFAIMPASSTPSTGLALSETEDPKWKGNKLWHAGNFNPNNKANTSHTHSDYATKTEVKDGTLKAGKAVTADTATKLSSATVGGTDTPVYINEGVPTAVNKVKAAAKADQLELKTLTEDTVNTTPGTFAFKGESAVSGSTNFPGLNADWAGIQIDSGADAVQIVGFAGSIAVRQNDSGVGKRSWTAWGTVYTDKNKPTAADVGAAAASHTHDTITKSGGGTLKFWSGTQTAYNELGSKDAGTLYIITG